MAIESSVRERNAQMLWVVSAPLQQMEELVERVGGGDALQWKRQWNRVDFTSTSEHWTGVVS